MDSVVKLPSQYMVTCHFLCLFLDVNETFVFKIHQLICYITTMINSQRRTDDNYRDKRRADTSTAQSVVMSTLHEDKLLFMKTMTKKTPKHITVAILS